jgi:glucan 1,3-beta-glucosidase
MGVNLGGWLSTEPFITPAMYQKYPEAVDEYTLSIAMAADTASGGLNQLERHYDTFIVSPVKAWEFRCSDTFFF